MAQFDFTFKQGDTKVVATDTLSYSDGTHPDLTGATIRFVMRALSSATPMTLTGSAVATDPIAGAVQYSPSAADTATAGLFMAEWAITFPDSTFMTFPTRGYLSVSIEENLTTTGGQQLVSLPDLKEKLKIPANNRTQDAELIRYIEGVRPTIENITGPIIPQIFDEWHDGGQLAIQVRRRPSTTYGTSPILELIGVDEYVGAAKYPLTLVGDPAAGTTYSVQMDRLGKIVRRTAGGGQTAFRGGTNSVHVVYRAGQAQVPWNVYEATLEVLRLNYRSTQGVGRGRLDEADVQDEGHAPPLGFLVPGKVREMLAPNKRAPSFA